MGDRKKNTQLGAAIGSIFPGPGNIVGAAIGGMFGGGKNWAAQQKKYYAGKGPGGSDLVAWKHPETGEILPLGTKELKGAIPVWSNSKSGGGKGGGRGSSKSSDDEMDAMLQEYAEWTKGIAEEEMAKSRELWSMWKTTYQPGETAWAKQTFAGIPADQEVAWATQGVNAAYDRNQAIAMRELQRLGINPASPAYASLTRNYAQARAAAEAGARNTARREVRDTNWQRRKEAVQIGSRLPGESSTIAGNAAGIYGQGVGRVQNQNQFQTDLAARLREAALGREFAASQAELTRQWQSEQNELNRDFQEDLAERQMWADLIGTGAQAAGTAFGMGKPKT
jgi:hypothetical protein